MTGRGTEHEMRVPSRRGRRRNPQVDDEDRGVVLDTAQRLLEEDGAAALSVRRLAKELGTSYQLVYTLFGGKQGLLDALFQRGFERLEASCRAIPETDSPANDLARFASAYRDFALANRELYGVMFGREAGFEPSVESLRVALESLSVVNECAARAFDGSPAAQRHFADAQSLSRAAWSATHGHVAFEIASWFGSDRDAAARLEDTVRALVGEPPPQADS